jgi:hypothetical protein
VERVLSKKQVCKQANISDRTLDRENAAGRGPVRTQLGLRRWGVTVSNFDDWLASRRIAPRSLVDAPVKPASPAPSEDTRRLTERPPNVARRRPLSFHRELELQALNPATKRAQPAAWRLEQGSRRHPKQPPSPVNAPYSGGGAFTASSSVSSPWRPPHDTNIVGKLPSTHSPKKRKRAAERDHEEGSR